MMHYVQQGFAVLGALYSLVTAVGAMLPPGSRAAAFCRKVGGVLREAEDAEPKL